ncbi:MAG: BON domain-containing protein [Polyangiaceae bacterium]|nr:BON domain-containing protein [Polyangiaceae bacterium]
MAIHKTRSLDRSEGTGEFELTPSGPRSTSGYYGYGPKGYLRSDERIHAEVCDRLMAHDEIDASDIEVIVDAGRVTLLGTLADVRQKALAETVVRGVLGVRGITSSLILRSLSGK